MDNKIYDFSISTLGECKVQSPIQLSTKPGDFIANYVTDNEFIRYRVDCSKGEEEESLSNANLLEKAGPREKIFFNPSHVHAAVITCGGLCPGLNDVIRAVVRCLWIRYGVRRISGIRFGFKGLLPEYGYDVIPLDPDKVDDCHKTGGSMLGTSRGGGNRVIEIADAIENLNVNMVFIIGGDGTQRGSLEVADRLAAFRPLRAVYGNIDGQEIRSTFPMIQRFTIEGIEVLLKHIGGYPGRYDPSIRETLMARPPKLLVCGHSHILKVQYDSSLGTLCVNPGAAGISGFHKVRTLVRLVIDDGTFSGLEVIELSEQEH